MDERKTFFGVRVVHSKSQPTDDKQSLKGAWSHHVTHFKFESRKISLEWLSSWLLPKQKIEIAVTF